MQLRDGERKISPGRALFVTVGLKKIYAPGAVRITQAMLKAATQIEPEIHDIVNQFLDGKREYEKLPDYDHDAVSAFVYRELNEHDALDNIAQFNGHPSGDGFAAVATAAREYLQMAMPKRMAVTVGFGPKMPGKPGKAELFRFRRQFATVEDPRWAIRQLLSATFTGDIRETLAAVWPDALAGALLAAETGIANRVMKNAEWRPSRRIGLQLGILTGKPMLPSEFVLALQKEFEQGEAPPEQSSDSSTKTGEDVETPVQRIASR